MLLEDSGGPEKELESPDMLCWLSLPVAEANDGGLKCFVAVNMNVSGLEGPTCGSSMTTKKVGCELDC